MVVAASWYGPAAGRCEGPASEWGLQWSWLLVGPSRIRQNLHDPQPLHCRQLLMAITRRVDLTEVTLAAQIDLSPALRDRTSLKNSGLPPVGISTPIRLTRRGNELKLILQGAGGDLRAPDPNLIKSILDARLRFAAYTRQNKPKSITDIAIAEGASPGDISRLMQLAFLAPDLIEAILDGRQPPALTATRLRRFDCLLYLWDDQLSLLS